MKNRTVAAIFAAGLVAFGIIVALDAKASPARVPRVVGDLAVAHLDTRDAIVQLLPAVTTNTTANNGRTAIATFSTGTESAPSTATAGLDLTNIGGVVVILSTTTTNATAGGTLQAYVRNVETGNWGRVPDLDLTAIAATTQSWPGLFVPVSRGRVAWVPNGIGTVNGAVYIVGQPK
jgi:hypothetical protein